MQNRFFTHESQADYLNPVSTNVRNSYARDDMDALDKFVQKSVFSPPRGRSSDSIDYSSQQRRNSHGIFEEPSEEPIEVYPRGMRRSNNGSGSNSSADNAVKSILNYEAPQDSSPPHYGLRPNPHKKDHLKGHAQFHEENVPVNARFKHNHDIPAKRESLNNFGLWKTPRPQDVHKNKNMFKLNNHPHAQKESLGNFGTWKDPTPDSRLEGNQYKLQQPQNPESLASFGQWKDAQPPPRKGVKVFQSPYSPREFNILSGMHHEHDTRLSPKKMTYL